MKKYRIIGERNLSNPVYGERKIYFINEDGAKIIWSAYVKLYGQCQTMERREERGGICHLSEIDHFKKEGALESSFDWKQYQVAQ